MKIHPAVQAYGNVAVAYERGRPEYAAAAIPYLMTELALGTGGVALDLGAGTGKLTKMLDAAGLATVAVDPIPAMLDQLRAATPRTTTVVGTAEAIPLPDQSVDVVTVAQAFHWFRAREALAEIHRVLRPGGGVALIWNRADPADPIQVLLRELTDPPERKTPHGHQLDVSGLIDASGIFFPAATAQFGHLQTTDENGLVSRLRSSSFVASLAAERQHALELRLRSEIARFGPVIELAYKTVVHLARAR